MCWDPGVAVGLVVGRHPLLLLEVEVEVLLKVVRVKLTLGGHNCHLRKIFLCGIFYVFLGFSRVGDFSVSLTLVFLPAGLQIGASISSDPFSPLTPSYFGT